MTTSEIGLFALMAIACILWAVVSYSIGFKEGHKEGYQRGRAVTRHISAKAVSK
jgi:ammonia channel protein AmtB